MNLLADAEIHKSDKTEKNGRTANQENTSRLSRQHSHQERKNRTATKDPDK